MMKKALRNRLQIEYEELLDLGSRVAYDENGKPMIEIEPLEVVKGFPPEKYLITYRCKGIIGVKEEERPVFGNEHKIEMHLRQNFLEIGPALSARTSFWHPNIDHKEPYHICVDLPNFVEPTTPIYLVVLRVGELIQYKKYHAEMVQPYPQDQDAAKWVLEYAEPRAILGKDNPIDNRNLLSEIIDVWSNDSQEKDEDDLDIVIFDMTKNIETTPPRIKKSTAPIEDISDDELDLFIGEIKELNQSN
jgi:hypothetical protein